jgi:hypothetical protein
VSIDLLYSGPFCSPRGATLHLQATGQRTACDGLHSRVLEMALSIIAVRAGRAVRECRRSRARPNQRWFLASAPRTWLELQLLQNTREARRLGNRCTGERGRTICVGITLEMTGGQ